MLGNAWAFQKNTKQNGENLVRKQAVGAISNKLPTNIETGGHIWIEICKY